MQSADGEARRANLVTLQARLRDGLVAVLADHPQLGWSLPESVTPIQPLIVGENLTALRLSARLEQIDGLRVPAIRPPTVPVGTARLRITLSATHTAADIGRLLDGLNAAADELCR